MEQVDLGGVRGGTAARANASTAGAVAATFEVGGCHVVMAPF